MAPAGRRPLTAVPPGAPPAAPRVFPLAPMSRAVRVPTAVVVALPALFLLAAAAAPPATARGLAGVAGLLVLLAAGVWLWSRPQRFEVDSEALVVVWPVRRRRVPRRDLTAVRLLSAGDCRAELGRGLRIGVGGLWGGFGWLWTARRGVLDFYVSRTDGLVLVERRSGRPLLITPEQPDEFVAALRR